jgi:hypothetical protein
MTALGGVFDRVHRAVAAIVAAQDTDGSWSDFEVAGMGASGPWVTAAIGLRLVELPAAFRTDASARAVERAIAWLAAEPTWSYNSKTPADADSIAHALLLLATAGRSREAAVDQLLGFQTVDGGFSTFAPNARGADFASWSISHPDVTPVAVRALAPHRARADVATSLGRALDRLTGDRADGRWPAFWWALDWYTAAAWSRACAALAVAWPPPTRPPLGPLRAPLDAAYLLEVALAAGWEAISLAIADTLCATVGDGELWPAVASLRVVAPNVARPWELSGDHGGRRYADLRGLYSSAIIASALAQFAERFATG